ncbi:hypothetical protein Vadar_021774 [Vaccinium darrowii]|uniref:Uncharacterized protein n=1 Tax=Vaccinium darrowii TaxID=229202 RepID=A0ACB7XSJ5_9ERIC|nr:hypothetical protein Vadar_021774 [Vaccinium darrowii]
MKRINKQKISKRNGEALKYLKDIMWYRIYNPKGFKLELGNNRTEIEWYPVKCLAHKILKKKRNKWSKNAKLIMKTGTYMWLYQGKF